MSLDSLRRHLTWSEEHVLKAVAKTIPNGGRIVMSRLADEHGVTRTTVHSALRKAALAGLVDQRSLGAKGSVILVRDPEAWAELARSA